MSDTATASTAPATASSPATATPAATSSPATPATPAAAPAAAKAPKLSELKAARRERSIAATKSLPQTHTAPRAEPTAPAEAPPAEGAAAQAEPAKPATAEIDMDADALGKFTDLSRRVREAETKYRNAKAEVEKFSKFQKAEALAKEGKHYDAAREAGIDVDAALAELLGKTSDPNAAQIDRKLADRLEALEKRDADREKADAERKEAETAAALESDRKTTREFVTRNLAKYPFLAKSPKLVDMAFKDYTDAKAKHEADSGETMTAAEQTKLLLAALSVHEDDWRNALGEKKQEAEAAPGIDGSARAGVKSQSPPPAKKLTFDELKAERAAKRRTA